MALPSYAVKTAIRLVLRAKLPFPTGTVISSACNYDIVHVIFTLLNVVGLFI